ncbi:MAG: hypothetical protein KF781_02950 [Chitinophagaceae bacterium]|nr:hypothetical protein [Chitinophagaceae bacterium]MCW5904469.1 hypothetical protein [Chitinophagaceae bacterium]
MKYSQLIGIIASLALIAICFMPWVHIPNFNITLSGVNGKVSEELTFGKQFKPHTVLCIIMILFFIINKIWAKRINVFIAFISLSWAIKNYIIFSICRQGICPEKQISLYLLVFFALVIQICSLLPKIQVKQD